MAQHKDEPLAQTTTEARAGVTGHNVHNVLFFSLVGAVIFLAVVVYQYSL